MYRAVAAALIALAGLIGPTTVRAPAEGTAVCTITDARAVGLSGLIVTADGFTAISDSNIDKSKVRIWYFDPHCRTERSIGYPTSAYDPEDAALGRDGALYVADIGDNDRLRKTVGIWRLAPGSHTPKLYRYAYPDGAHDAEALLLTGDDQPIIVTKQPFQAGVYTPIGKPNPDGEPVALRKVGTVDVTMSSTPNGEDVLGSTVVTGGAQTTDRDRVALRTYADAYEWPVTNGDVIKAITSTPPRITPLPGEPAGESIAYAPDGRTFYTLSDVESDPMRDTVRRYPSAIGAPSSPSPRAASPDTRQPSTSGKASGDPSSGGSILLGAGATLAAAAIVTMVIRRRRRP